MATITREKILKYQGMAPVHWRYDYRHYVLCNEHQLIRTIPQEDGSAIRATVLWTENYRTNTNEYGCTWRTPTGTYSPELHVAVWTKARPDADVWHSYGLGKFKKLSDQEYSKRVYKELCKWAELCTEERIRSLLENGQELQFAL